MRARYRLDSTYGNTISPRYSVWKGDRVMPTISMFYGIVVRMYFAPKEHPPPHFHV